MDREGVLHAANAFEIDGLGPQTVAAMRVEELLETGDREGHDLWLRIYQQVLDKTSHGE